MASSKSRITTDCPSRRAASKRRFVDQVGEVRAGESRGARRDLAQVDGRIELHVADVNLEHLFAALDVGLVDEDLAIEAARAHQRGVEHFGTVRRRHDDDRLARVEAVHLGEQLIERLLALLVAADRALHARLAERIELVDEDDAWRLGLGLREQIADARGADADEHFDELGSAQAEEGHLGLAGDRAGQQRLAGPRRADEQHALRNPAAQVGELARGLQELDDFAQLLRGFIHARDILERRLDVVLGVDLGLAARERHDAAFGAAKPSREERPRGDDQHEGQQVTNDFRQPTADDLARVLHAGGIELLDQFRILDPRRRERGRVVLGFLQRAVDDRVADLHFRDLAAAHQALELAVGDLPPGRREEEGLADRKQRQRAEHPPEGGRLAGVAGAAPCRRAGAWG